MIFFLIIGIVLGALLVVFILQNMMVVTVSFFAWQMTASLALILFLAVLCGVTIALLLLLPNLIRDDLRLSRANRRAKELENELADQKAAHVAIAAAPTTPALEETVL
ncbi:MAG TPA: LapA family protein [Candidatus Paceibacterota bacterium]|nr:LapA family protein [Candidatus Paceibacterota bacterium]